MPSRAVVCPSCGRTFTEGERFCPYDRAELPEPPQVGSDSLINTTIEGRYTVLERLGTGGMGVVYKSLQHRLNRHVALKILSPRFGDDPAAADRFRIEALAASQLTSPHTVSVYDFGAAEDGSLFIAMQLLEGESLRARLRRGPMPPREAVSITMHVCESLAEAHERPTPIFHRDIKPDNIFVRESSEGHVHATVLDFGLARFADSQRMRLTSANIALGTPAYMSPEQCRGNLPIDGRSDLYSVGIVLYEMLTGKPPFESGDPASMLFKHVYEPPPVMTTIHPELDVPQSLHQITMKLLGKQPEDRPASARVVVRQLQDIYEALPRLTALPTSTGEYATSIERKLVSGETKTRPTPSPSLTPTPRYTPRPMAISSPTIDVEIGAATTARPAVAPAPVPEQTAAIEQLKRTHHRQLALTLLVITAIAGLAAVGYVRTRQAEAVPGASSNPAPPQPVAVRAPPPPPAPLPPGAPPAAVPPAAGTLVAGTSTTAAPTGAASGSSGATLTTSAATSEPPAPPPPVKARHSKASAKHDDDSSDWKKELKL